VRDFKSIEEAKGLQFPAQKEIYLLGKVRGRLLLDS